MVGDPNPNSKRGKPDPQKIRCPHCAGPLTKEMETSEWTVPPLIRDSFSMIGSAVGGTAGAFYGFNHVKVRKWRPPRAAVIPNFHIPMRSYEVKNRTNVDEIKALRLISAIKTPYLPDGRFDLEAYDTLVNMQIDGGVEGIIVGGTTGEGQLMSWDEHIMLIGHTVNCFGSSVKVIDNTGSNSTREAIHATEQGLVFHFESVLQMGPTIVYNVPSRTGQDIPLGVIWALAQNPNLAGVKECVGHARVGEHVSNGLVVWSGNDDECHDSRRDHRGRGVISVASNLVPGLMREMMFGGKNPGLNARVLPLVKWLFEEPNPIGVNTALAQLGVVRPVFRLPYVPRAMEKRVEFVKIVEELGRESFVGDEEIRVLDDDDFFQH
ncbi:4-hydroxy-tetrahydrodipicolinate synthase 2-chloroplastic [Striga hermonthica]|uniref:4-hydroxy-tetrahydrodipicolinate synthase 2-chloroplastic n=1 Tax=Striga hermonthica TaxID=68872 RepID=A0A9N7NRA3_STRHE|nr:4-hydroxy-tetrahydrodipicolinate synthase 2-chloroplastic [Striga hermonthica]